jgi:hypothetical protein
MKFDREDFLKTYKGKRSFTETMYYSKFIEVINNEQLLNNFKFCNDVLGVPPVKVFINYFSLSK